MFLPINIEDMNTRGWDVCDFIIITGDAYVDHPSFGVSIISRVLERYGYKVGIIAQPDWKSNKDFMKLKKPKLGFLITSGNIDSMVNHYTVNKKKRRKDVYSPNDSNDKRPDRAVIVYSNKIREIYKDVPIIIGGIEASLRRFAHYDYWDNKIRRSILLDSQADLLVYGMGENQIIEIADNLNAGIDIRYLNYIEGTSYKTKDISNLENYCKLPGFFDIIDSKKKYAESFKIQSNNTDNINAKVLVEEYKDTYVVQNIPSKSLSQMELDDVYDLDYMYTYHPCYDKFGGISAIKEIKFSITSNRGCYGGCNFCALNYHQGRRVIARSHRSIIDEAKKMINDAEFKGYIHDVGGPTANFRHEACDKQLEKGVCKSRQCLFPSPCPNLKIDHTDYLELLKKLRNLDNVKKVFIRSGIRFDYVMADKDDTFLWELCKNHVSGQLRVAPEHVSDRVLQKMGKPKIEVYNMFKEKFEYINEKIDKKQYILPYLISSHPGSTLKDAILLAEYVRDMGYIPEQVQDFYPTPGTMSTCMYYTGIDPRDMSSVYVAKSKKEKMMQRALIQYKNPKNYDLVKEALIISGRKDLIGYSGKCLIRPNNFEKVEHNKKKRKR